MEGNKKTHPINRPARRSPADNWLSAEATPRGAIDLESNALDVALNSEGRWRECMSQFIHE